MQFDQTTKVPVDIASVESDFDIEVQTRRKKTQNDEQTVGLALRFIVFTYLGFHSSLHRRDDVQFTARSTTNSGTGAERGA